MDYRLLQRRNGKRLRGTECWLVAFYEPDGETPVLAVTNNYDNVTYDEVEYTSYNVVVDEPPGADPEGLPTARLTISNVPLTLQESLAASDYYRGGKIVFIPYNTEEAEVDYAEDTKELYIVSHETTLRSIVFTLAVPQELIENVPEDLYGPFSCRHRFQTPNTPSARCGYVGQNITDVGFTGGDPVHIRVPNHGFVAGDYVELSDMDGIGITPSLDGTYVVTPDGGDPTNVFTLNGTDGGNYSGSYGSGGVAGYAYCGQTLMHCRVRDRVESYGGMAGLRSDTIVVGI